jgi:hypothetical protein
LELIRRVDRLRVFGGGLVGRVTLRRACGGRGLFLYISFVRVCLCVCICWCACVCVCVYAGVHVCVGVCMLVYLFPMSII